MRSLAVAITLCAVQTLAAVAGSGIVQAQDNSPATSSFLDFAAPCEDPLLESTSPKLLDTSQTKPRSKPGTALTAPEYPTLSRRLGEEGVVVMRLLVNESGEVTRAEIVQSTGSSRLDTAALENTRNWHLQPGSVGGKPRCMWGRFSNSFVLTDYTDDELQEANVGAEARELAHQLMSVDQLRDLLLNTDALPSEVERQIVTLTLDAAAQRREWIDAQDKVARIVALEFSPAELVDLSRFFGSPVAKKWMDLTVKMTPTVMAQRQLMGQTLACSIQGIDRAMKSDKPTEVVAAGRITEKYQKGIARFISEAIPYCTCLFRKANAKTARVTGDGKTITQCGLPPKFE